MTTRRIARLSLQLSGLSMLCLALGCAAFGGYHPELAEPLREQRAAVVATPQVLVVELPRATAAAGTTTETSGAEASELGAGAAVAAATRSATIGQVVRAAKAGAFAVLEAVAELEQASGQAQAAAGQLLPGISLSASAGYLDGAQVGSFGKVRDVGFARYEPAATLFFRANPGAAAILSAATRRQAEAAALDLREAEREAMRQAALAYQDLVLARSSMAIADQLAADASTFYEIARARVEVSLGSGADVARAQSERARAEQARIRARAGWEETSIRLARLLHWPTEVLINPQQRDVRTVNLINADDPDLLVRSAALSRPDLRAAKKRASAASQEERAAWWNFLGPDLDLSVRERVIGTDEVSLEDALVAYAFVGFSFDFSEAGRVRSASGQTRSMAIRAKALSEAVRADVHRALSQLRTARAAIPQARLEVEAAERGYVIQRDRFEAGTGLGLEVIESQNAKARARLSAVEALLRLNAAQVELAAATGLLSPTLFD